VTTEVVVGRVGRPHGVRGELSVEVRTDEPDRRFAPGTTLVCRRPASGPAPTRSTLTVAAARRHQDRLLVRFEDVSDRDAAEPLRGVLLVRVVDETERPDDPEEFYDHQLVGLAVRTASGRDAGVVADVVHAGAQDLLVVRRDDGESLVPFVSALVPRVDLDEGVLVVVDLPGLLDGDSSQSED
jgi:16S rRNA processing protein RimM